MKKDLSFILLILACLLSCAPIAGIIIHHQYSTQKWENLNQRILEVKVKKDEQISIFEKNKALSSKPTFHLDVLNQYSRTIPVLEKEKKFLNSIPEDSLLFHDKKILSRKKMLATMPVITWSPMTSSCQDEVCLCLSSTIEMETEELSSLLNLFNDQSDILPFGFFSHVEMTKQTTPLNNQVWCVQAEVICH